MNAQGRRVAHHRNTPFAMRGNPDGYTAAMRRWLVLVMLVFLPLQFSGAAVAAYCDFEARNVAGHLGHHDHAQHVHGDADGGAASDRSPDDNGQSPAELDCKHCHGQCTGMLAFFDASLASVRAGQPSASPAAPALVRALAPPERPQWPRLA